MNYIYGQLNQKVYRIEYEGEDTSTAFMNVDNRHSKISVDVRCVPNSLLIDVNGETKEYNGIEPVSFKISDYAIEKVAEHSEENVAEYILTKDGVQVGDTVIEIPDVKPVTSVELDYDQEEGHYYLIFTLSDGTPYSCNFDKAIIKYIANDGYITITDGSTDNEKVISLDVNALKEELGIQSINDSIDALETNVEQIEGSIPTKTSELTNDSGFITDANVPTKTSDLTNDSGFITANDIPSIPSKTSDLTNDSGFITDSALDGYATEQWVEDKHYITSADIPNIDQHYDATSTKAQSGKAVAEAVSTKQDTLTETQLNAVNSGIDSFKVSTFSGYGTAIESLQSGKQDNLIPSTNISIVDNVISATDTTYTAGNGLSLNGTEFSVDTTTVATKSDLELKQDTLTQEQLDAVNSGITSEAISNIENTLATKQDELTAGDGIEISEENVISVTDIGTTYDAGYGIVISDSSDEEELNPTISIDGEVVATKSDLETKQDTLIAGEGITITDNTISADVGTLDYNELINKPIINIEDESGSDEPTYIDGEYYKIDGTIARCEEGELTPLATQNDLEEALTIKQDVLTQEQLDAVNSGITSTKLANIESGKQDKLVAGENISIDGNVISGTNTVYYNGTGLLLSNSTFSVDTSVIATKNDLNYKQDTLTEDEMSAVDSGINSNKVASYDDHINNNSIHTTQEEKDLWNSMIPDLPEGQIDVLFNADVPSTVESVPLNNILVGDTNYKISSANTDTGTSGGSGLPTLDLNNTTVESLENLTPYTMYQGIRNSGKKVFMVEGDYIHSVDFDTASDSTFSNMVWTKYGDYHQGTVDGEEYLAPVVRFVSDKFEWRKLNYYTSEPSQPVNGEYWLDNTTLKRYLNDTWQTLSYVTVEPSNPPEFTYWLDGSDLKTYVHKIRNIYAVRIAGREQTNMYTLAEHNKSEYLKALYYAVSGKLKRYTSGEWVEVNFTNGLEEPENPSEGDYWLKIYNISRNNNNYYKYYDILRYESGTWTQVVHNLAQGYIVDPTATEGNFWMDMSETVRVEQYFGSNGWKEIPSSLEDVDNSGVIIFNGENDKLYVGVDYNEMLYTDMDYFSYLYVGEASVGVIFYFTPVYVAGEYFGGWYCKTLDLNITGIGYPEQGTSIDPDYSEYRIDKVYQAKFVDNCIYERFIAKETTDLVYVVDPSRIVYYDEQRHEKRINESEFIQNVFLIANGAASAINTLLTISPQDQDNVEIQTTDWENADSSLDPFKFTYSTNTTDIREINEDTKVELVYGNPVQFAKYGFSILDITNYYPLSAEVVYTNTQNIYRLNGDLYVSNDYGLNWGFVPYTTTEPLSPSEGDLWLENSTTLKKYVSGEWVKQVLINIDTDDYWYKNQDGWYQLYKCYAPDWHLVGGVTESETAPDIWSVWYQPSTSKMFRYCFETETWVEIQYTNTKASATLGTYYYNTENESVEEYIHTYDTVSYQAEKQEYANNGDLWIKDLGNGNYRLYEWKSNQRAWMTFGAIKKPTENVSLDINIYYDVKIYPWASNIIFG